MTLEKIRLGFAMTGSFCTFQTALTTLEEVIERGADATAILSYAADMTDTRFMTAESLRKSVSELTQQPIIRTIAEAEPIGPQKLFDILVVIPATGNTLAKLACGIADTPVTMAVKSHLRNNRPVVLGISTNDALGNNAKNIGALLNTKHVYFVPFGQDDPARKPKSMVYVKDYAVAAIDAALQGQQLQPIIVGAN